MTKNAALTAVATSSDSDMSMVLRACGQMSAAGAAAGFSLGRLSTTFDFASGSLASAHSRKGLQLEEARKCRLCARVCVCRLCLSQLCVYLWQTYI